MRELFMHGTVAYSSPHHLQLVSKNTGWSSYIVPYLQTASVLFFNMFFPIFRSFIEESEPIFNNGLFFLWPTTLGLLFTPDPLVSLDGALPRPLVHSPLALLLLGFRTLPTLGLMVARGTADSDNMAG